MIYLVPYLLNLSGLQTGEIGDNGNGGYSNQCSHAVIGGRYRLLVSKRHREESYGAGATRPYPYGWALVLLLLMVFVDGL